jgi:hypothetical protein
MREVSTSITEHENVELLTKVKFDYLNKNKLLKALILGYIREDPLIREYIEKLKEESGVSKKKRKRQAIVMRKLDKFYEKHTFTDDEISNIFDLIESGDVEK